MSDAELLRAFIDSRDDLAFGRLVARHAAGLRRVAMLETGNAEAAEDVTQAAFIVLSRRPKPAYRSARRSGSAEAWLHQVARYAAANWRRAEQRRRKREKAVAQPDRVERADPSQPGDLAEAVASALRTLRRRDRRLILLRHVEEKPWSEVAARVGMSPEAARKATDRAMERLKGELKRHGISAKGAVVGTALASLAQAATTRVSLATSALNTRVLEIAKETLIMLRLETGFRVGSAIAVIALAVTLATQAIGLGGNADGGGIGLPGANVPAVQPGAAGAMPAHKQSDAQVARTGAGDQAAEQPGGDGDILRIDLAEDVGLEVLAITDGEQWWTPSGRPLEDAKLYVNFRGAMRTSGGEVIRERIALAIRLTGDIPSDANILPLWSGVPIDQPAPEVRRILDSSNSQVLPSSKVVVVHVRTDQQSATEELQIGFEPFRTVARFRNRPEVLLDEHGQPVALGLLGDRGREKPAAVVNIIDCAPGTEPLVVLFNANGVPAFGVNEILHLPNGTRLTSTVVPNLTSSEIEAVEVRRRPVINVRIKVAAQPGVQVEPEAAVMPTPPATRPSAG